MTKKQDRYIYPTCSYRIQKTKNKIRTILKNILQNREKEENLKNKDTQTQNEQRKIRRLNKKVRIGMKQIASYVELIENIKIIRNKYRSANAEQSAKYRKKNKKNG